VDGDLAEGAAALLLGAVEAERTKRAAPARRRPGDVADCRGEQFIELAEVVRTVRDDERRPTGPTMRRSSAIAASQSGTWYSMCIERATSAAELASGMRSASACTSDIRIASASTDASIPEERSRPISGPEWPRCLSSVR